MQLTREFFELQLFHVLTFWQHEDAARRAPEAASLLFVEHAHPDPARETGFLLRAGETTQVERAVVAVRAWHADRFYPSVIESSGVLAQVASEETRSLATEIFGRPDFKTILVISALPTSAVPRERSLHLFQAMGIDHLLEFSTVLHEILVRISAGGNYAPSQSLQTLRLLKRYGFIRRQQLEFFFPHEPLPPAQAPLVDATETPDPPEEDTE